MCLEKLGFSLDQSWIERAHRLGRFGPNKNLPVIVKLLSSKRKDLILNVARKLKGTKYSVNEDFSSAVREARRMLLSFTKAESERFRLRYNKLSIGNNAFVCDPVSKTVVPEID